MLSIIIGPMFSGKSTMLLKNYNKYIESGKKCLVIKYRYDNRYSEINEITTHDNKKIKAESTVLLENFDEIVNLYDVVLIDEIQFFNDANYIIKKWSDSHIIVECYGLNGDYNRNPFEQISNLIPLCDNITFLKAIDKSNGKDAIFTYRKINNDKKILIGGKDVYESLSRFNYLEKIKCKEIL